MDNQADRNASIKKLGELIEDIDIAMLTTIDDDSALRSRPMGTQQIEFDGDLWFFVGASSAKAINFGFVMLSRKRSIAHSRAPGDPSLRLRVTDALWPLTV